MLPEKGLFELPSKMMGGNNFFFRKISLTKYFIIIPKKEGIKNCSSLHSHFAFIDNLLCWWIFSKWDCSITTVCVVVISLYGCATKEMCAFLLIYIFCFYFSLLHFLFLELGFGGQRVESISDSQLFLISSAFSSVYWGEYALNKHLFNEWVISCSHWGNKAQVHCWQW